MNRAWIAAAAALALAFAESATVAGLREALQVSSERAISAVAKKDGFQGNPKVRIALPGQLGKMSAGLRAAGMGGKVDELELQMNRAAERASKEATPVFAAAIAKLTVPDATAIVKGDETAGTQYFKSQTSGELRTRFQPIVAQAMQKSGLHQYYQTLVGQYSMLPLSSAPKLDLESYVTQKTLDGLFVVMGDEEKKIRKDPVSRSTSLLKQVFGP